MDDTANPRSRAWVFILRGAFSVHLPESFLPHTNFVAWAAYPGAVGWTLRGYCQWMNPRTLKSLSTRYSTLAEWIPVDITDKRIFAEHTTRLLPLSCHRYVHGVPYDQYPSQKTVSLPKLKKDQFAADLITLYSDVLSAQIIEETAETEPTRELDDGLVTDDGLYWYDPLHIAIENQKKRDREAEKYYDFSEAPPLKKRTIKWKFFE